ncbi:glycosyltransferase [Paenibacillus qinlingensis]|uniref:glycosyltransferase n=1 Tax=Paenibacillus qinlingensis TaxID=1837343 RepID=UPI001563E6BF|nr:glycosyltransferase [Paenibacillus qinlingensis]
MKKILITGTSSYVGNNLKKWLLNEPNKYSVDSISLRNDSLKGIDFSEYDVVFHVAGIAHINETKDNVKLYYEVNRDLAYETAKKAKRDGVNQFIFLSSMSVYGIESGVITKDSPLKPKSNYGKSKLQAEELISTLEDEDFKIAKLRPPIIYGKGCKGNYPKLASLILKTPIFPDIENKRSMIYIDNLSEFVKWIIDNGARGLFIPQNKEYVKTSKMVQMIAEAHGKRIQVTKLFNPLLVLMKKNSTFNKIFGDLVYEKSLSKYDTQYNYFIDFKNSIKLTEDKLKKIVILSNHHTYTYNFRKEIIQRLLEENYKVYIVLPYGEKVELLKQMGCEFIDLPLDRRGMNPISDLKLLIKYYRIIENIKPDAVLSYTIKPNIYGGLVCRLQNIPYFPNVTGLGTVMEKESLLQKVLIQMYRLAYKNASCIFFQNEENKKFFERQKITMKKSMNIPGSGVNTQHFSLLPYPCDDTVEFVFISRIMKEKGIDQYLEAAEFIGTKYQNTKFHVLGFCEEDYEGKLKEMHDNGFIIYHGMQSDVREFHKFSHCTVHPTYYPEGMSNVLLESAACGRPIITTNRSGCREVVDDGINGYVVEQENSLDLIDKIERFLKLDFNSKKQMGISGRLKVEKEFDRNIVVKAYYEQVELVVGD